MKEPGFTGKRHDFLTENINLLFFCENPNNFTWEPGGVSKFVESVTSQRWMGEQRSDDDVGGLRSVVNTAALI